MAALPARAGTIAVARALPPMLCMLLLGGVPLVDGQSLPGVVDRHEVIVESTRLDIFETVDTRGMTTGRSCNGDRITFREDGTGFTFDEEVQGTFCQAAFLNVSIPGPARTVTVAFTADRVVTNEV